VQIAPPDTSGIYFLGTGAGAGVGAGLGLVPAQPVGKTPSLSCSHIDVELAEVCIFDCDISLNIPNCHNLHASDVRTASLLLLTNEEYRENCRGGRLLSHDRLL